jgi:hypothetical protein
MELRCSVLEFARVRPPSEGLEGSVHKFGLSLAVIQQLAEV